MGQVNSVNKVNVLPSWLVIIVGNPQVTTLRYSPLITLTNSQINQKFRYDNKVQECITSP